MKVNFVCRICGAGYIRKDEKSRVLTSDLKCPRCGRTKNYILIIRREN